MRGGDKALPPLDETLDGREPGALLIEAGALKSDAEADDAEPRVVHVGDGIAADGDAPTVDEARAVAEMALTVPETDPERVAYAMWNEGRADEAIEFLRRQIAAERDRRRETALAPASAAPSDATRVEPASDWRERHQAALTPADFNAFGASVHTIDITPTPADAIVAHGARRSQRTGWLMGACLAVLSISATGAYFVARDGYMTTAAFTTSQPIVDVEPVKTAAAAAEPEAELATVEPDANGADVSPPVETEVADISLSADAIVDVPPPEEDAPADGVASIPPEENMVPDAVAPVPPASRDDVASALPVDASLLSTPSGEDVAGTASADPLESDTTAPEATASIEPSPEAAEPAPIVEARLPRQRPEPPAFFTEQASAPQVASQAPAVSESSELPFVVSEPPKTEAEVASVEPEITVYGPDGPVRVYRHIRRMPYPPVIGRAFPGARRTLTPAEYQALLERRAWAERYSAERRTGVVGRILTLP